MKWVGRKLPGRLRSRICYAPPATMDAERSLTSHNIAFLEALYEQYERDPDSVDPKWRALIEHEARRPNGGAAARVALGGNGAVAAVSPVQTADAEQIALQSKVDKLIEHYRLLGHLRADLDPLGRPRPVKTAALDLEYFGLGPEHLDRKFNAGLLFDQPWVTLREILGRLQRTYTRKIGVEYWQINDMDARSWLRARMEPVENEVVPSKEEQLALLRSLTRADGFDRFLHSKFVGAKRFSVAGAESVIALLQTLIEEAAELGVTETVMGMAHRGRLSVMTNVMDQSAAQIFSRFEGGDPWENLGSGDVKYHLGSYRTYRTRTGKEMYLALAFNPSHLEAITPVIAGRIRASQDRRPPEERSRILGITLHGDGAVMGQGVYTETLNLSGLRGYTTEGTIRVIINNQVAFTTEPDEARSTIYPTATADMLNAPVFHVNGDDPEAAAYVAKLAVAFRQEFKRDVIIDLVCYRRFGHNEGDEPTFTQPLMCDLIKKLGSVREKYEERLIARGTVTRAEIEELDRALHEELEAALAEVRATQPSVGRSPMHGVWEKFKGGPDAAVHEVETRIEPSTVEVISTALTHVPAGFKLHRKLERFLEDSRKQLSGEAPVSWALAEHLAYGSLLLDGANVRISGQDVVRGTFSHRHAGWTDVQTGERYYPLQHIPGARGKFHIYNSPLSEFAVVGFEFGYSLAAPDALVIWEAQFGDFANGAQVIIDQFVTSSEDKWNRISGLTMFLPHGYEGQGPEHSSARLERFLQLCAEDNIQVCSFTEPAQLFHALRRQVLRKWRKPLVVMTPKSLLRTRESFSPLSNFTEGRLRRFIDDETVDPTQVRRVMLCTGKVYYDLVGARRERRRNDVALLRIEQLYPFPAEQVVRALGRYVNADDLLWVQEEPRNMGAWTFIRERMDLIEEGRWRPRYVGRVESASPATGSLESHKLETDLILQDAFEGLD